MDVYGSLLNRAARGGYGSPAGDPGDPDYLASYQKLLAGGGPDAASIPAYVKNALESSGGDLTKAVAAVKADPTYKKYAADPTGQDFNTWRDTALYGPGGNQTSQTGGIIGGGAEGQAGVDAWNASKGKPTGAGPRMASEQNLADPAVASQYYYGKAQDKLTPAEQTQLAGLTKRAASIAGTVGTTAAERTAAAHGGSQQVYVAGSASPTAAQAVVNPQAATTAPSSEQAGTTTLPPRQPPTDPYNTGQGTEWPKVSDVVGSLQGVSGISGQTPTPDTAASLSESITNSPTIQAALDVFRRKVQPGIENSAALAGLGRSTSVLNASADAQGNMLLPLIQDEYARQERSANARTAATQQSIADLLGLSGQQGEQNTNAVNQLMQTGGVTRGVAQAGNDAAYSDFLRRQGLSEQGTFGPLGQLAPSTFGSRTIGK